MLHLMVLLLIMVPRPITHYDNLTFSSGPFMFCLSNVLRVPSLCKNFLSVAKFICDHLVSITFFPWGYVIRDLPSTAILFQGRCKDGRHPVHLTLVSQFTSSSKTAFAYVLASSSLWHLRLGHPSAHRASLLSF